MRVAYDEAKRRLVLEERGLDLADADSLFDGFHLTRRDDKHSDVEERFVSVGELQGLVVIVVWTLRDDQRRIITMWKANEREKTLYFDQRGRAGRDQA